MKAFSIYKTIIDWIFVPVSAPLQRRKWQPTPELLPGQSHGRRTLVGDSPWGRAESDTTDFTFTFHFHALEKEMEPTPVFLPGESHGQRSLVGYSPWVTESDTTE